MSPQKSLNIVYSSTELLNAVLDDLYSLNLSNKKDADAVDKALKELNKINQSAATRKEVEKNIGYITDAAKELDELSMDISAIRTKLDELLKIWQKKWSLMPVESAFVLPYEIEPKPVMIASAGSLSGLLDASKNNEALYFYHTDHLGTPILITDGKGSKVWEAEYMPFGEVYSITGSVDNNLRFPGQYYEEETGLYQNWHRDYKPEVGRYIEKDPIGLEGGMNQFIYVGDNPINERDPKGLKGERYEVCEGHGCILKWFCKKYVDWGCSGTKEHYCCEAEHKACMLKIDPLDTEASKKEKECYVDFMKCKAKAGGTK